ncbi:penicillin-binding protein [Treponema zioleckii]|uniref:penicillin-binding protein n=1 Tax=Treponema zioleckii TaxID=331680 RepID=UPI00168B8F54|nr:penicillin-binding protein [Treponema zioleckii]
MQINNYLKKVPTIVICVLTVIFAGIVIFHYGMYAFSKKETSTVAYSENLIRGSILDRNGKALAVSTNFYQFGVTPSAIKDVQEFSNLIAPVIGEMPQIISQLIFSNKKSSFLYIKKKIDQSVYDELKTLCNTKGFGNAVRFDRIPGRIYPENNLASQLIGFTDYDGKGSEGIEYSMNDILMPLPNGTDEELRGKNIYLTIDANLQYKLEKIAQDALTKTGGEALMLVAAEAKTGEILSYISLPSADLNDFGNVSQEALRSRPVSEGYEPGSVFKIFSVAAFLDTNAISKTDIFTCDGVYERRTSSGEVVKITCLNNDGPQTAREALQHSCNDALAQMSDRIDSDVFLKKIRSFGFGEKTGIELSGETTGLVRNTSDRLWSARSKPTIAIGQEIQVSAMQMVQAATAIANGGVPVKLTLIDKITDSNGKEDFVHKPIYKDRVLKESTATYLLSCMESVTESGTGRKATIGDISIGTKTGTAQMADHIHGGYSKTDYISNCIAVFPVEAPEIILYIVIEKAKGEQYAGRIVAPVIKEAANVIIDYLGMSRKSASSLVHSGVISISGDAPVVIKDTVPNFVGMSSRQILPLTDRTDLRVKVNGYGWVTEQKPAPGTPVTENMEIELYLE